MSRSLVAVFAHPDDDAYCIAGSVALHAADPEFRFVLVVATDGEAGDIREGFPATREGLGALRRAEDAAAWRAVGREPDRCEWLGYPDGKVPDVPFDELVDRIAGILGEERPDVVATFGPDGIFGHPDHVTVGAATDAAFLRLAPGARDGFRRLCHGVIPDSVFNRWNAQRAERWKRIVTRGVVGHRVAAAVVRRADAHRPVRRTRLTDAGAPGRHAAPRSAPGTRTVRRRVAALAGALVDAGAAAAEVAAGQARALGGRRARLRHAVTGDERVVPRSGVRAQRLQRKVR